MAISDRIDSIEQHLKESYQELQGIGIDTSEVNNNLENIPKLIDGYWQTLPKVTGEGTSITLDNTKEGKMGIIYKGNTYQNTTTGKNLLPNNATTQTINDVTFTVNEDKTIKVNGTASARTVYYLANNINVTIQAGTYTLSSDKTDTGSSIEALVNVDGSNQYWNSYISPTKKTISQSGVIKAVYIIVENGATINTLYKPQLESGSSATSYEPYTGGYPSPNPDYPQPIHTVSGDNTIKVEGKNLISSYTKNAGNQIYFNGVSDYSNNFIFKPGTYTFSYINNGSNSIFTFIKEKGDASSTNKGGGNPITFTTTKEFNIWLYRNGMQESEVSQPQLEKGSQATTYEPYKGATYPINLPEGMELCKIGTYQDRIFKNTPNSTYYDSNLEDNVWYLNKQIGKVVLDENSTISALSPFGNCYRARIDVNDIMQVSTSNLSKLYSNYFYKDEKVLNSSNIQIGMMCGYRQTNQVYFGVAQTTIDEFKTWLGTHNTEVYYVLATPTYTEITGTTLLSQLEALKTSYEGQTNISQENNNLASVLNASALSNTTNTPSLQSIQPLSLEQSLQNEEPMVDEEPLIDEETPNETLQEDIIQENDNLTNILDDSALQEM